MYIPDISICPNRYATGTKIDITTGLEQSVTTVRQMPYHFSKNSIPPSKLTIIVHILSCEFCVPSKNYQYG